MSEDCPFHRGSVGYNLWQLRGIWHDRVELFELDGSPLAEDSAAGSPGQSPFENLVYIDFDGETLVQTNVHIRGRAPSAKTFCARYRDGLLAFDSLGPGAYRNIGVSGGEGLLIFTGAQVDAAWEQYFEPDIILLTGPDERLRTTLLYRHGKAVRTLRAQGKRLAQDCTRRHALDTRGVDGAVHGEQMVSQMWSGDSSGSLPR